MSKGAAVCGISQPAASQQITALERHLNVVLLDRSTRPLTLTPAGKLYLELCRDLLRREEQFHLELEELKGETGGAVRVACIYSVGLTEIARLRAEFAARCPQAAMQVEYARPEKIYDLVREGQADIGIVSYPAPSRDVAVIPWREEQMVVAMAPQHPLAGRAELAPRDLDGLDFVAFDEDLTIRREVDRFLKDRGVHVNVVLHFDNIQTIKEALASGTGLSILPARTMQAEIEQFRLVALPLRAPELVRPLGLVHHKRRKLNRATQQLLELLLPQPEPVAELAMNEL